MFSVSWGREDMWPAELLSKENWEQTGLDLAPCLRLRKKGSHRNVLSVNGEIGKCGLEIYLSSRGPKRWKERLWSWKKKYSKSSRGNLRGKSSPGVSVGDRKVAESKPASPITWNREAWTFPKDKIIALYRLICEGMTSRHQIEDATGHQGINSSKSHNRTESTGKYWKALLEQSPQIYCAKN